MNLCEIGISFTGTFELLKIDLWDEAMGQAQTYEWQKRFKEGRTSVDGDPRSGREVINSNRRLIVRVVDEEVNISKTVCHEILRGNLGMHHICAVPVDGWSKNNHVDVSLDQANNDDNFLTMKNIITGNETWVYRYDVETKAQTTKQVSKMSPRPKQSRQVRSEVKHYMKVIQRVREVVREKDLMCSRKNSGCSVMTTHPRTIPSP